MASAISKTSRSDLSARIKKPGTGNARASKNCGLAGKCSAAQFCVLPSGAFQKCRRTCIRNGPHKSADDFRPLSAVGATRKGGAVLENLPGEWPLGVKLSRFRLWDESLSSDAKAGAGLSMLGAETCDTLSNLMNCSAPFSKSNRCCSDEAQANNNVKSK